MKIPKFDFKKIHFRPRTHPGAAPGTVIPDPDSHPPRFHVMAYDTDNLVEEEIQDVAKIRDLRRKFPIVWVHVDGLGDPDAINELGGEFGLHPLALEDIHNLSQRSKVEEYEKHLYIVVRVPLLEEGLTTQQLNVFLGEGIVVTIQQVRIGYLDPVRERIRKSVPRERMLKADYLAYAILDSSLDSYFPILEHYVLALEEMEIEITSQPSRKTLSGVYSLKRDLHEIRRAVWPLRETTNALLRENTPFISGETRVYLRDCYDHAIQLMDMSETFREFASDLVNQYMTRISNDMNAVMKVLTIIATIFIPLGFIAGLYGMNFNPEISPYNMPELNWYCGYPFALGLMIATAVILLIYFRWRKWL